MTNPLLAEWNTPFGLPPFDAISDDDFAPAIDAALADHKEAIDAIASLTAPPTFENVIEPLEATSRILNPVLGAFFSVAGADSNPAREALQREYSPKLAVHFADMVANEALFARLQTLWETRCDFDLTEEQARVLHLTYQYFARAGAGLKGADKTRMKEIMTRLAELGTAFSQNLLADERDWHMPLAEDQLDGLPDFALEAARQAGADKGLGTPIVTLSRSLIVPFLQFSTHRDLRETAYKAWTARGANGGETDNRALTAEILSLREERARLLGYASFADYKLEPEMAKTPQAVRDLLMSVWAPDKARANEDATILAAMLAEDGINGALEPWDWRHYAERRRKALHDLDEAELKPYFQLDRMIDAAFDCATKLFGLTFKPVEVPLYHPDCRAWEVMRDGKHIALFIGDYFARASKRSGAWCSAMRSQSKFPDIQAPIVINVCNFAKSEPALLSYDDARTLFHEFGHALHQMLSNVTYESISGTSVARDFVELPSQLYEHWLEVPQVLAEFATHAETGAPMPQALLDKVLAAATYDMGFQTVEYVASALVDLAFHEGPAPADPIAKQAEVLAEIGMPHAIGMRHATPHFAHVFSGDGYSSGYYSYMWSEVMDADAFAAFEEAGDAFDPTQAKGLETHILSTGGSKDPGALYTAFRGQLPSVDALLRGRGLSENLDPNA